MSRALAWFAVLVALWPRAAGAQIAGEMRAPSLLGVAAAVTARPARTTGAGATAGGVPAGFLWGTATSAHQVEGDNRQNDWWAWEQQPGRIAGGDRSGVASDHWRRYESDYDLLARLGCNAHRLSVEWSRIEPEEGRFDTAALARYRAMLAALRVRRIRPMVTLLHFTLPRWLARRGGLEYREWPRYFARFAHTVAAELGDQVDLWVTLNEPMVHLLGAHAAGVFPPGKKSTLALGAVFRGLVRAHRLACARLRRADVHDADGDGRVAEIGIAHHMRVIEPWSASSPLDVALARMAAFAFNEAFLQAVVHGRVRVGFLGIPMLELDDPPVDRPLDFIGVNYYARERVRFNPLSPGMVERRTSPGAAVSDMGWEIHPEGIHRALKEAARFGLPLFVTENGIADAAGDRRPAYLRDHIRWMRKAMAEGVPVRGYFHWSLIDNFEWNEGFRPRFGLYRIDYATQERVATPAVETYASICRGAGP